MNSFLKKAQHGMLLMGSLVALLCATGCGSVRSSAGAKRAAENENTMPAAEIVSESAAGRDGGDVLRVGDPITIEFSGVTVADPPPRVNERLKSDGMLRLPLIKEPVKAEGKTRGQLEEEIWKLYVPRIYRNLTVKVGAEGRVVHVGGEVRIEGRVQYLGEMTVLKAITAAGGFTDFANRKKVRVTRADGRQFTVNCVKAQEDSKNDVPVYPDDQIDVPRRLF